jgi:hypothetical protein
MDMSQDLRMLAQQAEGIELAYPDEAPGIGNAALAEIRGHICDIGTALYKLMALGQEH